MTLKTVIDRLEEAMHEYEFEYAPKALQDKRPVGEQKPERGKKGGGRIVNQDAASQDSKLGGQG